MSDDTGKNKHTVHRQRQQEEIEIAVVPLSNAVAHPRAVVIKPLWMKKREKWSFSGNLGSALVKTEWVLTNTVITEAAVGCPRRAKYFACEAVLELHYLALDDDLLGAWRWAVVNTLICTVGNLCHEKREKMHLWEGRVQRVDMQDIH